MTTPKSITTGGGRVRVVTTDEDPKTTPTGYVVSTWILRTTATGYSARAISGPMRGTTVEAAGKRPAILEAIRKTSEEAKQ